MLRFEVVCTVSFTQLTIHDWIAESQVSFEDRFDDSGSSQKISIRMRTDASPVRGDLGHGPHVHTPL